MSETKIDPASVLGIKSEDFIATSDMKACGPGGMNQLALDSTEIANVPVCPNDPKGRRMVVYWVKPSDVGMYKKMGVPPIPPECYSATYNGGFPLIPRSGRCKRGPDGLMYRDDMRVIACWTTPMRQDEFDEIERQRNHDAKYGIRKPVNAPGTDVSVADGVERQIAKGLYGFESDETTSVVIERDPTGRVVKRTPAKSIQVAR